MKNFLIKSSILTIIVFMLGVVLYATFMSSFYQNILAVLPLLFFVVTNLVHFYLLKTAAQSNARFTAHYMAASFLKMFFYLAIAITYAFLNKEHAKIFLINILLLYIIYTTFEVVELSKVFRQKVN